MKKRILSLALVLSILTAFIVIPQADSFAASSNMPKAKENGFISDISKPDSNSNIITTADELAAIETGEYVLGNDIYLGEYNSGRWESIVPSGNITIDGQGHKIYDLNDSGLIGTVPSGIEINIKNLGLDSTNNSNNIISNRTYSGAFVELAQSPITIENCYSSLDVEAWSSAYYYDKALAHSGNFIGYSEADVYIKNCYTSGITSARVHLFGDYNTSKMYVGGFIGYCNENIYIYDSYNIGDIKCETTGNQGSYAYLGTLVGVSEKYIELENCYNNSPIKIDSYNQDLDTYVGGLISKGNHIKANYCYNFGNISSDNSGDNAYDNYGCGTVVGGIIATAENIELNNCVNKGNITAISFYSTESGGLVGASGQTSLSIVDSYNDGDIIANTIDATYSYEGRAGGLVGITGNTSSTYISNSYNIGNFTATSSFESYAGGLIGHCYSNNKYIETTICNSFNKGNGFGCGDNFRDCDSGGLIAYVGGIGQSGIITVSDSYNTGDISSASSGGLIGDVQDSINVDILYSYNLGGIYSYGSYAGGLLSYIGTSDSHILGSFNSGTVYAKGDSYETYVGGLIGYISVSRDIEEKKALIENSYNNGELIASSNTTSIGGLISYASPSQYVRVTLLKDCYNDGDLISINAVDSIVGGLIAEVTPGYTRKISNSSSYGNISIEKDETFKSSCIGGVIGYIIPPGYFTSSYFSFEPICYHNTGNAIGKFDEKTNVDGLSNCIKIDSTPQTNEERTAFMDIEVSYYEWFETHPIPNAEVTCCGVTKTADENGMVRFYKEEISGDYTLSAKADGFFDYGSDTEIISVMPTNGKDYIHMTPKDPEKIYITTLTAESKNKKYNLQAGQSFTVDKTDNTKYTFKYSVDWNGYDEGKAYLRGTNSGKMLEFTDSELTITPGKEFDAGENVLFIVYTDDKKKSATIENLIDVKVLNEAYSLYFEPIESDDIAKIPFLSGLKVNLGFNDSMEEFADEIKVEDDKVILKFSGGDKNKSEKQTSLFNKRSMSVNLFGKLEVPLNDSADWAGEVGVKLEGTQKADDYISIMDIDYNTMVVLVDVPIPVTASVMLRGGLESKIGVSGLLSKPNLYGSLIPSLGIEVFGGLGADYDTVEAKAGVYGSATGKLAGTAQTADEHWDFNPSLEGSYGVRASVKVWLIDIKGQYEAGNFKWTKDGFNASWLGQPLSLYSIDNEWQLAGREYLENGGGFVGDIPQIELFDLDVSNKDERLIYENIFENSEAILQNIDDVNYLIFTVDDTEREQQNGLKIVYSAQNSDGTWSSPVAVNDDGTLDSTVSASGRFVIWEDMKSSLSANTSDMKDILSQTEISVAQFNGTEWISERLTDNSDFDFSPVISSNGDTAMAAWLSNSEADFSAQSGTTDLHYATYDGSAWSDVTTIEDIGTVTRVTADYNGTNGNIFYKKDNSLYTVSTSDNNETALGYDEMGQYTINDYNGETVLAYFDADGKLQIVTDVLGNKEQSTIETDANINSIPVIKSNETDMYICWIDHQNGYDTFSGVRYDENDGWSDKITFVSGENNVSNPSLTINSDGTFTASYLKTGKAEVQGDGSYTTGTTDLYVNTIVPSYNLALNQDTMTYNDEAYSKGGVAALTFDVSNIGENEINGINVEIYENGELKETFEKDVSLKAGATQNISVVYTTVDKNIVQDIKVKVVPKSVSDFDESDNSGMVTIGAVDMTVSSAYFTQEGGRLFVNAILNNNGSVSADEAIVQIHKDSINGEIIYEEAINDVLANEELFVKEPVEIEGETVNYFVTVNTENDADEYNNFSIAVFDNSKPDLGFTVMEDSYTDDNMLELSVKLENNTDVKQNVELIMATYDTYGTLQKIKSEPFEMEIGESTVTKKFDCDEITDNFTFKLFIWDSLDGMKPIDTSFEKVININ